ncbi:MAG: aminopeptidase P family protein, partial [Chloroflexi bacterium]|nr:aminopeptidase P family protein [Chloroflexota bacterium]
MGTVPGMEERDARFRRLRQAMEKKGLKALVIGGKGHWWTGRGYFRYLTDFHLWGHDGAILLPVDSDPMLTLSSGAVAGMIARRGWITETYGDPTLVDRIAEGMKKRGLTTGKVGIVGYNFILGAGVVERLKGLMPGVTFVDADMVMNRVRAVKSPLEIQQNRELWVLAKSAMERFVEAMEEGRTQWEISAEAQKVVLAGGGRDILVFFGGVVPTDQRVKLEGIIPYHHEITGPSGHWCELTVTLAYREPTALELKLMETELLAYEEIRKAAKPGVRLSALMKILERVYVDQGWKLAEVQSPHHDLHGQGMDTIEWPLWGHLDQTQDTELEDGMMFSYHPSRNVLQEVRATGINENIVITKNGAE